MPPTPVDDHTEEFEQLAGLSALDALDGEDLARFEAHVAHCERCRVKVRQDRETLAWTAPEMDPSPDFKARLMARAAEELAAAQPPRAVEAAAPEPIPFQPRRASVVPLWSRSPWASAIAALLVLGLVTAGGYTYQNQVIASYALSGSVAGSAVVTIKRSGATQLEMRGVADPPSGFVYEAWIIPPNAQPIAAGVTSSGNAQLPLDRVQSGATVAITQERGKVDAPTSAPVMAVVVRS